MTLSLSAEQVEFRGWRAYALSNEYVRLVAVPDIGGRIMGYDLGSHPFLFVDRELAGKLFTADENQGDGSLAAWKNYGGAKTWPAPQGWENDEQWHGPPDPVLDTGRYWVDELDIIDGHAALHMISPSDVHTGVQIGRRFGLSRATSRVNVELTFANTKDRPIRWSLWDVVQLCAEQTLANGSRNYDPSCTVTCPVNPQSRFPGGFNVMFGAPDNQQWHVAGSLFRADYQWVIGKVGLDSPAGWIAYSQGSAGVAFAIRFAHEPGAEYPDGGATVECWTVGSGQVANLDYTGSGIYLMEAEVLSPLRTIAPGNSTRFSLEWGSCRCEGPVLDVQVGGCTGRLLSAWRHAETVELAGGFGAFDAGQLLFVWRDQDGRRLASDTIANVDPLTPIVLEHCATAPLDASTVELQIVATGDSVTRLLARAAIQDAV